LDDTELQAKLEVDRLVQRSRSRLDSDEVLGIRARLAALVDRDWFEEERHPASPDAVFEALKESIATIAPDRDIRSALLTAFEPHVSAELNQLYQSVNSRLKSGKVLPEIRPKVTSLGGNRSKRPEAANQKPGGSSDKPGAGSGGGEGGGAGAGGDAQSAAQLDSRIADLLAEMSQGSVAARASATQMLSDPAMFDAPEAPLAKAQPEFLQALTSFVPPSGALVAPEQLLEQIDPSARSSASALDQLTVEMVSMVFDYIYTDKRLADQVKQQLLRLQVVAIKAALIDRSFFARRRHPMRMLIDRICEVAVNPDMQLESGSPLVVGIEQLVDSLLAGFDNDLGTFNDVRAKVDQLVEQEVERRAARLARITKAAERAEAVLQAWSVARSRFLERMDPDTPSFVKAFVDQWWSMVLAECEVSGPTAKLTPAEALEIGEILIWSVAPKMSDEVGRLAGIVPRLVKGLNQGLKAVKIEDSDRSSFFDALLVEHTQVIAAAKQGKVAQLGVSSLRLGSDGKIRFAPSSDGAQVVIPQEPIAQSRNIDIAELGRGDFVEIDMQGKGEFLAFRLAWVSPSQQLFVLSRHPEGAMSLDRAKLAALFDRNRARVAPRDVDTDRAIAAIANSQEQLEDEQAGPAGA
ncbi:MAG: DUF1631 family protein, partial [Quisquiliibacterium sp.]